LSTFIPGDKLQGRLTRGETPSTPSYYDRAVDVPIIGAEAGANQDKVGNSFDDNELSEWSNDGSANTAWITYHLGRMAQVDDICIKLTGWRMRSYPLEIYAGKELIWTGDSPRSLGYIHIAVKPVMTRDITIKLKSSAKDKDAYSGIVEVVAPAAGELDLFKAQGGDKPNNELRIVEIEFKENLNN
jgi:beta-galactosidase